MAAAPCAHQFGTRRPNGYWGKCSWYTRFNNLITSQNKLLSTLQFHLPRPTTPMSIQAFGTITKYMKQVHTYQEKINSKTRATNKRPFIVIVFLKPIKTRQNINYSDMISFFVQWKTFCQTLLWIFAILMKAWVWPGCATPFINHSRTIVSETWIQCYDWMNVTWTKVQNWSYLPLC